MIKSSTILQTLIVKKVNSGGTAFNLMSHHLPGLLAWKKETPEEVSGYHLAHQRMVLATAGVGLLGENLTHACLKLCDLQRSCMKDGYLVGMSELQVHVCPEITLHLHANDLFILNRHSF